MRVEHIAFNVRDPAAICKWYCGHLGLHVVKQTGTAFFLSDETGHGIIEIYHNPPDSVPDYEGMDPLILHLAFQSDDLGEDRRRLVEAGATPIGSEPSPGEKYGVLFLKDPWGFTIQLVRREEKILR